MMRISFPYPEMKPLDIPERNLLGIFSPSIIATIKSEEEIIEEAFSHPIGSDPLPMMLEGHKRVLILVDDYTRTTPVQKILPRLLRGTGERGDPIQRYQDHGCLGDPSVHERRGDRQKVW